MEPTLTAGRGLWHAAPHGRTQAVVVRAVTYLGMPCVLALLFGATESAAMFARAYADSFVVGGICAGILDVMYQLVWPRLLRQGPRWPARVLGHVVTLALASTIAAFVAREMLAALF